MSLDPLSFAQWLLISEASVKPAEFFTRAVTQDGHLMSGAVRGLGDYATSGSSSSNFLNAWGLLRAEERASLVHHVPRIVLRWGDEAGFRESLERLASSRFLTHDDLLLVLDATITYLFDCMIGVQLDEASPFVIDQFRVFRFLKVVHERASATGDYELDRCFYESSRANRHLKSSAAQIAKGAMTENWATRLALWHYVMSVVEPRRFVELVSEELASLDSVLKVAQGSYEIGCLQLALSSFCPPFVFMSRSGLSPADCFRSLGGMLLTYDLWLLTRVSANEGDLLEQGNLRKSVSTLAARFSLLGFSSEEFNLGEVSIVEPALAAMVGGLMADYTPLDCSSEDFVGCLTQLGHTKQQLVSAVLSLAMGGERGVSEIVRLVDRRSVTSQVAELLWEALGVVPGWRGANVIVELGRLACSPDFPKLLGLRCAYVQLSYAASLQSGREDFLFDMLNCAIESGAQESEYCTVLSRAFCREQDAAVSMLCKDLDRNRAGVTITVLRHGGEVFLKRLSLYNWKVLVAGVLRFVCRDEMRNDDQRLALMEAISVCRDREVFDRELLMLWVLADPLVEVRVFAAKQLAHCLLPLGASEAAIEQLGHALDRSTPTTVVGALARSYLPHLSVISIRDWRLAEAIAKRAVEAALSPEVSGLEKVAVLREVLAQMEPSNYKVDNARLSRAHCAFIGMVLDG